MQPPQLKRVTLTPASAPWPSGSAPLGQPSPRRSPRRSRGAPSARLCRRRRCRRREALEPFFFFREGGGPEPGADCAAPALRADRLSVGLISALFETAPGTAAGTGGGGGAPLAEAALRRLLLEVEAGGAAGNDGFSPSRAFRARASAALSANAYAPAARGWEPAVDPAWRFEVGVAGDLGGGDESPSSSSSSSSPLPSPSRRARSTSWSSRPRRRPCAPPAPRSGPRGWPPRRRRRRREVEGRGGPAPRPRGRRRGGRSRRACRRGQQRDGRSRERVGLRLGRLRGAQKPR